MLLENAPCVECMDKGLCFLLQHRNIIATASWILLLKPSFLILQGQPCWYTFNALYMSATNKRPIECVKPKLTILYLHSSHACYEWLLYYKIQQFFLECVIMHECNNNFAFPSQSSIHTSILNIHCFFFRQYTLTKEYLTTGAWPSNLTLRETLIFTVDCNHCLKHWYLAFQFLMSNVFECKKYLSKC